MNKELILFSNRGLEEINKKDALIQGNVMSIFPTPTKQELEKLEFDMWIIHNTLHEEATVMVDKYPNIRQIETGYGEETMPDIKYFEGVQALDDFYNEMNLDFNNIKLTDIIWSKDESRITLKINGLEYNLEVF